jgi:hypothetical protein
MFPRNDEDMGRSGGMHIPDREHISILEEKIWRGFAFRYVAENAAHLVLSKLNL